VTLILLAIGDIAVSLAMVRIALRMKEPALEERATASVILTFVAVIVAMLSAIYLLDMSVPSLVGTGLLGLALLLVSLPQFVWAVAYWLGTFR